MVKKKVTGSNQKKLDTLNAYKAVFGTEDGMAVLYDMMKTSSMFGTTFDQNPYQAAFNEGRRSFCTQLVQMLQLDEKKLRQHMQQQEELDRFYNNA